MGTSNLKNSSAALAIIGIWLGVGLAVGLGGMEKVGGDVAFAAMFATWAAAYFLAED